MDTWPLEALLLKKPWWRRSYVKKSGGTTLNGDPIEVVSDGGGRWLCDMEIHVPDARAVKLMRALIDGSIGGTVPQLVPFYADAEAPYPLGVMPADVPHSDGTSFDDGSLYTSSGITVTASASALGATSLTIAKTAVADDIDLVGSVFSIDHPTVGKRLYTTTRINGDIIAIAGPLQEAISDDTFLDYGFPACVMRLTNADTALAAIDPPYVTTATLQFRECPVA